MFDFLPVARTDVAASPNSAHFTYEGENRHVTAAATVGGTSAQISYGYDGQGRRVSKSIAGGTATDTRL